jgi:DNA-binding transcriptional ArsR family regulator
MSRPSTIRPAPKRAVLSPEAIELISRRFGVLSEPLRLRLIHALFHGEKSVNALAGEVGGTQANISRHLQTLTQAGMLARRKEGLQVFYSIGDPSIVKLCDFVCGSLERQLARQAGALSAGADR